MSDDAVCYSCHGEGCLACVDSGAAVPSDPTTPTLDVVRIYEIALRSIDQDTKYAETAIATASAALATGERLKSAARAEVGVPSVEQLEAAAKAMYDDRMVARWGAGWAYEPWEQFAEKYTQAADNDRQQAKRALVAACSVRGDQPENAKTEE